MTIEESIWIKKKLSKLDLPSGSFVLDVGSSTREFRQLQSHIEENVFSPLRERGFKIIYMDKKSGDGIDIVVDIEDSDILQKIEREFKLVLCTNVLEHVNNVEKAMRNIISLVSKGGYLLVTVPYKYPRHDDPIDNLYRASDEKLQKLIAKYTNFIVISSEILDIRNRRYYVDKSKYPLWGYRKFRFWRYYFKWFRWKISCLLIKIL